MPTPPNTPEQRLFERVRLPGLDPQATPLVGLGLGLTGLALGLRPRLAAWPLALTAAAALLFRDPRRSTPDLPGAIFAPADGALQLIDELYEHRFLHTDALRIAIRVSALDVPVLRSPAAGRVAYLEEVAPSERVGWTQLDDLQERGSCLLIGIETRAAPILLAVGASTLARRPQTRLELGDVLAPGDRLATARLGARVDLLLPLDAIAAPAPIGARLSAGVTPIGRLAAVAR